ncbi:hypothetical protein R8871_00097 [Paraburkholderia graminis C4D1M]|jgi:hypothetical protein|uniref:Uncharacterized protein n=1 Tax=Paraburkholderia graminis (strain ATCC 700544 / DSM 17151 / LMG 18924 / NCIMB 13744 / C4D1M) TaxID=396598 RepID=B1FZ19_PARG4|nr:hypothetical protein [Paraburkholderia graminis]EDT10960.1 conserved hypothetical protein [Paraburkholderia graminis C4D1M]CAB3638801.1 hypothetical protein R8871_00097 [Paraburkholderia graminis C4D1M]
MKSTPQSSDGDKQADPHAPKNPQSLEEAAAPLPHENDQNAESQNDEDPRRVGKQAHRDVERGLQDTDRRGGGEYQEKTQNDGHADTNSDDRSTGAGTGKR